MWSEEDIERARKDFKVFLFMVWYMIKLPNPTEIQLAMADELADESRKRIILEGFRGVAKSFVACALCVWYLWNDPKLKIQIVSANGEKASLNASFIKKIIYMMPFLACLHLTAEDRRSGLKDTSTLFDVHGAVADISPSVKSVGINGQLTGSRSDILLADDVEIPSNSATQLQRSKLSELVKEFDSIAKPGSRIIYLGTPQVEESLYVKLGERGYETIIYPVEYPSNQEDRNFYGNRLGRILAQRYDSDPSAWAGKPTDPKRFNEEEIAIRRLSYGKAGFALQFMLNTNLSDVDKFPLRVTDLIVTNLDPTETSIKWDWASGNGQRHNELPCVALKGDFYYDCFNRSKEVGKYTGTMMYIDPSGKGKDETAFAITKFLNGYVFLMEVGGYRDGYTDNTLRLLATKAKFWGVNEVRIEPNYGGGMFTKLIIPVFTEIHPCDVQDAKSATVQKEKRIIDILEPTLARHKLIVNQSVITADYEVYTQDPMYSLIYQLTRLSGDRGALGHDDRLDALAGAIMHWIEYMDKDAQEGADEAFEDFLEQALDPDRGILWQEEKPKVYSKYKQTSNGAIANVLCNFWK